MHQFVFPTTLVYKFIFSDKRYAIYHFLQVEKYDFDMT